MNGIEFGDVMKYVVCVFLFILFDIFDVNWVVEVVIYEFGFVGVVVSDFMDFVVLGEGEWLVVFGGVYEVVLVIFEIYCEKWICVGRWLI